MVAQFRRSQEALAPPMPSKLPARMSCGPRGGRLILIHAGTEHDLGSIAIMPLSMAGGATYNVANLAGTAIREARPGDVLALPMHIASARSALVEELGRTDTAGKRAH